MSVVFSESNNTNVAKLRKYMVVSKGGYEHIYADNIDWSEDNIYFMADGRTVACFAEWDYWKEIPFDEDQSS